MVARWQQSGKWGGTILLSAGLLFYAWNASAASSEPDPFELSPEQLFGATVTSASRSPGKLFDAPAAIYVLSNEDIKRSGATSIPEALRMVPGVQVARTGASSWAISVRGFNGQLANKLLVLMDGREVYDGLFSGVYWDVQDTVMEDIDRIEVIRGPGASLWGANAVNGVINIITKSAKDTQGNLADATIGNKDRAITDLRHGGTFGEDGYYRVYGKYLNRDAENTIDGINAHDAQIADRGGFRADWTAQERNNITVQGDAYNNSDGQWRNVALFTGAAPFSQLEEENIEARGANLLGRLTRKLDSGSQLTVQSYLDYTSRDQLLIDDERGTLDLDSQLQLPQDGRHAVIVGGRYRLSHDTLEETRPDGFPLITFDSATRNDQLFSAFFQDKITLDPDRWFLTLGSKVEHNDYTGFEIQPNARLQFHPDDQQMVWASVSRAVRTPSRLEQDLNITQVTGAGASIDTLANKDFQSEELIAWELGYRRQLTERASLDVASFYNHYDKLADYSFDGVFAGSDPTRVVIGFTPVNGTKADTYGGETLFEWRARDDLNFSTSYSLLEMAIHAPAVTLDHPQNAENQSPRQQFNLRAQWDVNRAVTFDTMLYYTDALTGFNVPEYWRLDTRLGWQITNGLQFNLVGQNLLDNSHREFTSPGDANASEIARGVYGQFQWKF